MSKQRERVPQTQDDAEAPKPKESRKKQLPKRIEAIMRRPLAPIVSHADGRLVVPIMGRATPEQRQARKVALMQAFRDAGGGNFILEKGGRKWNADQWENETGIPLPITMEGIAAACERFSIATAKDVLLAGYTMDAALTMLHNELLHQADLRDEIISTAVAVKDYRISRHTIARRVADGTLKDHRPDDAPKNAPFRLSRRQLGKLYQRK